MNDGPVLVLNAGSSSLKFTVYQRMTAAGGEAVLAGQIEGIGTAPTLHGAQCRAGKGGRRGAGRQGQRCSRRIGGARAEVARPFRQLACARA
jgi:hypothetical protein